VFTEETVRALEALSLKTLPRPPAPRLIVLQRAEARIANLFPKRFASDGVCQLEEQFTTDYPTMMESPWLWRSPTEAISILANTIQEMTANRGGAAPRIFPSTSTTSILANDVEERMVSFGDGDRRFGILTEPVGESPTHAVLLVTSTFGYRIGPNRVNVALARHFARAGVATLRIDVRGVGDSRDTPGVSPAGPYDMGAVDDVDDALSLLKARGYRTLTVGGICAGSFLAWTAAERIAKRDGTRLQLVLVNIEAFDPIRYDRELMTMFEHPPPGLRARLGAAATLTDKAKLAWPLAVKLAHLAGGVAKRSAPRRLQPATLGARIGRLTKTGSRIDFIYSRGDVGRSQYLLRAALHHVFFHLKRTVAIHVVDGPDHSFTPRWAANELAAVMSRAIRDWGQRPA
jgi:hypothetical protein